MIELLLQRLSLISLGFYLLLGLSACTSPRVRPTEYAQNLAKFSVKEPCWVKQPNCKAPKDQKYLYFVGQSAKPLPQWGQPNRESKRSAMADAEAQYARYLGVRVQSSIDLAELQSDSEYQSQVSQQVSTQVNQLVSDLVKVDEHFIAYQETDEGQPLWTVYVLVQIPQVTIKKHRLMIKDKRALENKLSAQKAKESPSTSKTKIKSLEGANQSPKVNPDLWSAKVFNIDDTATIYVNGTVVRQCEFSRTCNVELNPHLQSGDNLVEFKFINRIGFWTYGYEVLKGESLMYQAKCGQVWVFGCKWNTSRGVIHHFKFNIKKK